MEQVKNLCVKLNDPELTAKFQKLCGIILYRDNNSNNISKRKFVEYGKDQNVSEDVNIESENNNDTDKSNTGDASGAISQRRVSRGRGKDGNGMDIPTGVAFSIQYPVLHLILTLASSLGNEAFYLVFYPYMVWNVDSLLIRKTALIWCLCMYVGQATKDFLQWPRPASPPVLRLETEFLQESGMPSTHAMSATAIPFMLALLSLNRYEVSPWVVVPVAVIWCMLVCLSRLYQGVHSVLDVLCGVSFSFMIMVIATPYLDDFDIYQQTHPFSQIVIMVTSVALCTICYPQTKDINSAKGDAVQIVAVTSGFSLGCWLNYQYGFTIIKEVNTLHPIMVPTIRMLAISVVRFFIGAVILAGIQIILKEISIRAFSHIIGLNKPNKKHPTVQTGYKFVVYYVLGLSISFLIPFLHCMFGLDRPSYFTEVV